MRALLKPADLITAEEYLERERAAETKSEYLNGEIVAMAGTTFEHNTITPNIVSSLHQQMKGRPCHVFGSDMKVRIESANLFRYPDVSALCGPAAFHDRHRDVYLNPQFICEVLSPGTEAYDRGDKFALYRLIESFLEYLVVAQDRRWAQLFRRSRAGGWESAEYPELDAVIPLESIGCSLRLAEIYDKVEFTPEILEP